MRGDVVVRDAHYLIASFSNYLISRSPDRSGKPGAVKPWFLSFGAATNGSRCQDHKNRLKGEDLQRRAGIAAQKTTALCSCKYREM